jgi:proteic killer suppression protein
VIKSFKDRETAALFNGLRVRKFSSCAVQAEKRLEIPDAAISLRDLAGLPGNRLEALKGNRKGQYSIRINEQWRVCFEWRNGNALNVEIVDYHRG